MQIICISRGSYGFGKELSVKLSEKLGYECIGREELTDRATAFGIPVGKIETAIMKRQPLNEELSIQIDLFKAFITESLCERALKHSIVYHGRTGHLILSRVPHLLRIRAIGDMESRIDMAMARMNLSREKAKIYNEEVDEDIRKWVKILYNVDCESPSFYDITINSAHLSVHNSAASLIQFAKMPEFQETPASRQILENLMLAARCRLVIGKDIRTRDIKVNVQAEKGNVTITYPPWQRKQAEVIPSILETVSNLKSIVCTVATTNILYIQEKFNSKTESFQSLVEVAEKWNAAVELVHLKSENLSEQDQQIESAEAPKKEILSSDNGGIIEETEEKKTEEQDDSGLSDTVHELIQVGRAGSVYTIYGGQQGLLSNLNRTSPYSLIVVGNVFLNLGESVRKRQKRDLLSSLADQFHVPVISAEELKEEYLFGPKQWLNMGISAGLTFLLYLIVFSFQVPILNFLNAPGTVHHLIAAGIIIVSVPIAASIIGDFAHNVLKLIKLE
ncbi:MAG: cytidylate kinase-like family protein [Desulfobacterales bacterium]|nr:cytidylate kinase-like family protein [Desulfobacterales bacterium]